MTMWYHCASNEGKRGNIMYYLPINGHPASDGYTPDSKTLKVIIDTKIYQSLLLVVIQRSVHYQKSIQKAAVSTDTSKTHNNKYKKRACNDTNPIMGPIRLAFVGFLMLGGV